MTKCYEPNCAAAKTDTLIKCSSPFCSRQFHLTCANLKGKKKNELDNIYFLCNSCSEFVQYSNSAVTNKLSNLEDKIVLLLNPIEAQLKSNETNLKEEVHKLDSRISALEESKVSHEEKTLEVTKNLSELENRIKLELSQMKQQINEVIESAKTLVNSSENEDRKENKTCEEAPVNHLKEQKINDTLVKYRVRVSGIAEAPSSLKYQDRQKF